MTATSYATEFTRSIFNSLDTSRLPKTTQNAFKKAFAAADYADHERFVKKRWIMVVDFTLNSKYKRGHLIDLKKKRIYSYHVSHGINSGDGKGNAVSFSNIYGSLQSSLGLYVTAETYHGKHGRSLRLRGLEGSNDLAYDRAIVIHSADYAEESVVKEEGFLGVSEGCPAVSKKYIRKIIRKLKRQSFYYIYHEKFSNN